MFIQNCVNREPLFRSINALALLYTFPGENIIALYYIIFKMINNVKYLPKI